jgi:DNA-binding NarL/FixJ family response regulator
MEGIKPKIKIAIVEDEERKRKELRELIEKENARMEFVSEYRNPDDALAFLRQKTALDIVIVDIDLKAAKDGVEVIKGLKPHFDQLFLAGKIPQPVKFLVNTISENRDTVLRALEAGALGYILKGDSRMSIVECITDLYEGGSPMSSQIARFLLEKYQPDQLEPGMEFANLTKREREVLELLSQGWSNAMIAEKLRIKIGVVKLHCNHIYQKLHVRKRAEAIAVYLAKKGNRTGTPPPAAQKTFWEALAGWFLGVKRLILSILTPKANPASALREK